MSDTNKTDKPQLIVTLAEQAPHITLEGDPNPYPPQAPGVFQGERADVTALQKFFHEHVENSVHSRDSDHYSELFKLKEALRLKLQSKHPNAA